MSEKSMRQRMLAGEPYLADDPEVAAGLAASPVPDPPENTVVGAGSVVVKDLPADVVAVGSARAIRDL